MISVILMAFISIFSSIYMSQISEFDGKTINLSGSLRMMSYRITTQVAAMQESPTPENKRKVQQLIHHFETLFNNPLLKKDFLRFSEVKLQQDYQNVATQWINIIKPTLAEADTRFKLQQFLPHLNEFVNSINTLVYGYQNVLEDKLYQLNIIQSVTLSSTLLLILLSIFSIHKHIARPLKELTEVAEASSNGDWSKRSNVQREDEFGLLSKTINKANDSIQAIHQDQERRIREKTVELSQNNEILTFLYNVAQQINESHSGQLNFEDILDKLRKVSALNSVELTLYSDKNTLPYQHIFLDQNKGQSKSEILKSERQSCSFTIEKNTISYGEITVTHPITTPLEEWQSNLIHSLVDLIAMALNQSHHLNQQRRMALLDERAIIARELHDSLAQSLSYLKIQVARIERGMKNQVVTESISDPVQDLKEGLISAYRQLRELLTTFRLHIGNGGLQSALNNTIQALSEHNTISIQLNYSCEHIPFEPNEEIHLLQIIKEALQNSLNHSQGENIIISLREKDDKSVALQVKDDGIGIQCHEKKLNHYGTEIMQERCHSLHGKLQVFSSKDKGTEVNLCFIPSYLNKTDEYT